MTRATVLREVRQMRFEELYARRQRRDLTMVEAAEIWGGHGADIPSVERPLRGRRGGGVRRSAAGPGLSSGGPGG